MPERKNTYQPTHWPQGHDSNDTDGKKHSLLARHKCWYRRLYKEMYSLPNGKEKQQHRTLSPHQLPDVLWEKLGANFFDFDGKKFLQIIGYLSRYLYVLQIKKTTAKVKINGLKHILSMEGSPKVIISELNHLSIVQSLNTSVNSGTWSIQQAHKTTHNQMGRWKGQSRQWNKE